MAETAYICTTCGVQYPPSETPPEHCPICEDERQYVNAAGQNWTTPEALRAAHAIDWRELEPDLHGLGATPQIAIGQRALHIAQGGSGVLWDCIPLVTPDGVDRLKAAGGVRAMAISHPHFFSAIAEWSEALGNVPIYLHEDLQPYLMRGSPNVRFWSGERHDLGQGITLVRCGGHFTGSTVLHWAAAAEGRGALLTGDTIMVVPDRRWMSFMRSFPNLVPLNRRAVEHIVEAVEPFGFERVYAAWWDRVCGSDAKGRLRLSAERYLKAISD
jgi:glyoxylase-like metal-dependent hydrolase (beta-lactamase superfamily II)